MRVFCSVGCREEANYDPLPIYFYQDKLHAVRNQNYRCSYCQRRFTQDSFSMARVGQEKGDKIHQITLKRLTKLRHCS